MGLDESKPRFGTDAVFFRRSRRLWLSSHRRLIGQEVLFRLMLLYLSIQLLVLGLI
jgi:hypothetical protein